MVDLCRALIPSSCQCDSRGFGHFAHRAATKRFTIWHVGMTLNRVIVAGGYKERRPLQRHATVINQTEGRGGDSSCDALGR